MTPLKSQISAGFSLALVAILVAGCSKPMTKSTVSVTSDEPVTIETTPAVVAPNETAKTTEIAGTEPSMSASAMVDTKTSVINWQGKKVGTTHVGTIKLSSGKLQLPALVGSEFTLDMNSIVCTDTPGLNKELHSSNFFDTAKFPSGLVKVTKATKISREAGLPGQWEITADLTLKDITKPVVFKAQLSESDKTISANADFAINRTDWGITYGSGSFFKDLANKAIEDSIPLSLVLNANK